MNAYASYLAFATVMSRKRSARRKLKELNPQRYVEFLRNNKKFWK